jgi:dinuclear metal center YbgI/SA1388 family protein
MIKRKNLEIYLNKLMRIEQFEDYTPNGLQIEGKKEIHSILSSPSVSSTIIEYAVENKFDAILVHHGFFWKNNINVITGVFREKVKMLLDNDINLFAYHLPLDFLIKYGNNEPVLKFLGVLKTIPLRQTGYIGVLKKEISCEDFFIKLNKFYSTSGVHIPRRGKIKTVGIVSGGGTSFFPEALSKKIDAFISGEGTEWVYQLCQDNNVAYSAMGHYKSECIGPRLLGEHLKNKFKLNHMFIEENNPF